MFRDLIPRLADRFYLIAPDYPGFGRSDAPAPSAFRYTFDHLTQIVDELLGQQRISRYSLYLQDYGGPIGSVWRSPIRARPGLDHSERGRARAGPLGSLGAPQSLLGGPRRARSRGTR
jgi:hypothetical protein